MTLFDIPLTHTIDASTASAGLVAPIEPTGSDVEKPSVGLKTFASQYSDTWSQTTSQRSITVDANGVEVTLSPSEKVSISHVSHTSVATPVVKQQKQGLFNLRKSSGAQLEYDQIYVSGDLDLM